MPKVIDILKTRWMEVLLLLGFQTGVLFLFEPIIEAAKKQAEGKPVTVPNDIAFLFGLGTMGFAIVWQMLYMGFLRTACVEGAARWDPGPLLRIGRYYFWRSVRLDILLLVVYSGLALAAVSAATMLTNKKPQELPVWLLSLLDIAVYIALMKLITFALPIMVARDVVVFHSITMLGQYRLTRTRAIPLIYVATLVFSTVVSLADETREFKGALHYIVMTCHHLLVGLAILAVHLAALRLIKASEPPPEIKGSDPISGDAAE